jgi:hypothetical protein
MTRARSVVVGVAIFALSCSAISGLDDFELTSGAAGSTSSAASSSGGGEGGGGEGAGGQGAGGQGGQGGTGMLPTCTDGMQNGNETGVDCGGSCLNCLNAPCTGNAQCQSGCCMAPGDGFVCCLAAQTNGCTTGSCNDGCLGSTESDVDCGGACGPSCAIGQNCKANADCVSNNCSNVSNTCQP